MKSSRNPGLLIVFLLIAVAMAVAFFPGVNENVARGLAEIVPIDTEGLDGATRTIFDSITYARSIHILAMLLVGFGFLMVFLRGHEFTSLTATFLAVSISVPVYLLVKSFLPGEFEVMNINGFLFAEFAAASLLICMGAVLGRLKMDQYFVLAILFTIAYIFNEWLLLESGLFPGFLDTGGSVAIHAFGAYFGLGIVATTAKKFQDKPGPKADKISNEFCLLGSMILWLFWPSFTSAVVAPRAGVPDGSEHRAGPVRLHPGHLCLLQAHPGQDRSGGHRQRRPGRRCVHRLHLLLGEPRLCHGHRHLRRHPEHPGLCHHRPQGL